MRWLDQTILHTETTRGNCMQAAVASLFGLLLSEVPNFAEAAHAMTEPEITLTLASLRGYRTGLGLDEAATRRIVVEVAEEGEREPAEFRDEVRQRMLKAAMEGEDGWKP